MQFQQSHLTHYAGMIAEHHAAGIWTTSLVEQLASNLGGWARGTCGKIGGSNKVDLCQLQSAVRLTVRRDHQFISIHVDAARALHHTRFHCELAAIFSEIDQALIDGDGGMTLMEPRITMSKYVMLSECNLDEVATRTDHAKELLSEAGWSVGWFIVMQSDAALASCGTRRGPPCGEFWGPLDGPVTGSSGREAPA